MSKARRKPRPTPAGPRVVPVTEPKKPTSKE